MSGLGRRLAANFMVVGLLSAYNVIIYLFYTELGRCDISLFTMGHHMCEVWS